MTRFESDHPEWGVIAEQLAQEFAKTAAARDKAGGTPKHERDRLRESGLLAMSIPQEYGGHGASWPETMRVVRTIAQADSSVAHVFGFHHLLLATVRLFGSEWQLAPLFEETVVRQWFWGNALNPLDRRTVAKADGDAWKLNGVKSFSSGAADSDILIVSALNDETGKLMVAVTPSDRAGITIHHDWDNMGQRQTDSGTVEFRDLRVDARDLLTTPGPLGSVFASLRPCLAQLILVNVFLGIAEGAFAEAKRYTQTRGKAWATSGVATPSDDPYILRQYGELWLALEGARLLADRAADIFQGAWDLGDGLTAQQRGETSIAIAAAKVSATKNGLDVVNRMFEVMGASATSAHWGFDRYWRNLRTHTLHDPVDYKIKELGEWALRDTIPTPTFYS
ncbi:FMNH2-dependent monooxygenase [Capsulimonas corticalis]|uniref:Dibenzothiophene monooxygenase n=1 Tax=Capsulimonas corticalis TaxID=2219043 RepID=A0A402D0R4_9BACT|nr:acyl-CoA dehydrogenase family protein [Capsulimonas corticalis]BDI33562.1 FMNH2-dependent monooxygenase [Capsulimonas corticalis]